MNNCSRHTSSMMSHHVNPAALIIGHQQEGTMMHYNLNYRYHSSKGPDGKMSGLLSNVFFSHLHKQSMQRAWHCQPTSGQSGHVCQHTNENSVEVNLPSLQHASTPANKRPSPATIRTMGHAILGEKKHHQRHVGVTHRQLPHTSPLCTLCIDNTHPTAHHTPNAWHVPTLCL